MEVGVDGYVFDVFWIIFDTATDFGKGFCVCYRACGNGSHFNESGFKR